MAFKTAKQYNEERFGGMFLLRNDGDSRDVIFLYRNEADVLVADTHYIKSADYSGYVHCTGKGCPGCAYGEKGLRVQTKLFIPLYDIQSGELLFWDRTMQFENQLMTQVFEKYPNPSEYVFRITRHGAARDVNTTYSIMAVGTNDVKSYDQIMRENKTCSPDVYERVCKSVTNSTMSSMLSTSGNNGNGSGSGYSASGAGLPSYQVTPRAPKADIPSAATIPPATAGVSVPGPSEDWDEDDMADEPNF